MSATLTYVAPGKVVSITYTLRDESGEVLDASGEGGPLDYLHGAHNIVPGLEEELAGKRVGADLRVRVAPERGYGAHDPRGVQTVPRSAFPPEIDLERGMLFQAEDERQRSVPVWIQSVEGERVTIDQNHPLAGRTLEFEVRIEAIRDATSEELAHGHAHGAGGHAH